MTKREYEILDNLGMLQEFYPNSTGDFEYDLRTGVIDPNKLPKELK